MKLSVLSLALAGAAVVAADTCGNGADTTFEACMEITGNARTTVCGPLAGANNHPYFKCMCERTTDISTCYNQCPGQAAQAAVLQAEIIAWCSNAQNTAPPEKTPKDDAPKDDAPKDDAPKDEQPNGDKPKDEQPNDAKPQQPAQPDKDVKTNPGDKPAANKPASSQPATNPPGSPSTASSNTHYSLLTIAAVCAFLFM